MAEELFLDFVNMEGYPVSIRKTDVVAVTSSVTEGPERSAFVWLRGGHRVEIQSTRANVVRNVEGH